MSLILFVRAFATNSQNLAGVDAIYGLVTVLFGRMRSNFHIIYAVFTSKIISSRQCFNNKRLFNKNYINFGRSRKWLKYNNPGDRIKQCWYFKPQYSGICHLTRKSPFPRRYYQNWNCPEYFFGRFFRWKNMLKCPINTASPVNILMIKFKKNTHWKTKEPFKNWFCLNKPFKKLSLTIFLKNLYYRAFIRLMLQTTSIRNLFRT